MEVQFLNQILVAFYSILFGIFLGLVHDFTSIAGLVFGFKDLKLNNKKICKFNTVRKKTILKQVWLCIFDIIYFLIISILVSVFVFGVNNGIVRWYIVIGLLIGFAVYKLTVGAVISIFLSYIAYLVRISAISFASLVKSFIKKFFSKFSKRKKKINKKTKKLLFIGINRNVDKGKLA